MSTDQEMEYARRLLRLAAFLEELPEERFDYRNWVGEDWKGKTDLSCGTTACALGWATQMPEFQQLGLRLTWEGEILLKVEGEDREFNIRVIPKVIFGLNSDETHELFYPQSVSHLDSDFDGPGEAATAKECAAFFRRFVRGKWGVK